MTEHESTLPGCGHGVFGPQVCPYQEDVNDDPSYVCTCCDECRQECMDDI